MTQALKMILKKRGDARGLFLIFLSFRRVLLKVDNIQAAIDIVSTNR